MSVRVTIQYFDGCPSWQTAQQRLISAADEAGIDLDLDLQRVETLEEAQRLGFVGSPTILVDGIDPFAQPGAPAALACRLYRTPIGSDGAPAAEELAAALERADRSSPAPLHPATKAQAGGIGTRTGEVETTIDRVSGGPSRLDFAVLSAKLTGVALASYVPLNAVKLLALRAAGARVGRGCALHHGLGARAASGIRIGADCWIAEDVSLDGRGGLEIGDHVSIGTGVQIWTAQHDWRSPDFAYESAPVRIGDRAWVNARSIVLPGVTIGEGAVVAAGAVVPKDVPPWTLVGGVPAKVLGRRPPGMRYELQARRFKAWWW